MQRSFSNVATLNERALRAGAGITFVAAFFAFMQAAYIGEYVYLQTLVVFLLLDFSAKLFFGVRYSPVSRVAQWIVSQQTVEPVPAAPKYVAWSIGLSLAAAMSALLFVFSITGPINLVLCGICMTFMFSESAFGVCLGCQPYYWFAR